MHSRPYIYRQLTKDEQAELLRARAFRSLPAHEPPHYPEGEHLYFITGACYGHAHILASLDRRREFAAKLHERFAEIHAWVVMPNHYHMVLTCDLERFGHAIAGLHNGTSTQWNREDGAIGRRVWYRFMDRKIRSVRHYFASTNYIHANPMKHGYVTHLADWATSSFSEWLGRLGRDEMARLWKSYPVHNLGKDWDLP